MKVFHCLNRGESKRDAETYYVTAQTQTQTRDLQLELKRNRLEFEIKAEVNFTDSYLHRDESIPLLE